ncbi:MAG: hypothetical protein WA988_17415, partial [Candidatus Nanopelagicales bacterium]
MNATPYKVPAVGIEYNEFVGSLGPYGNGNPVNTELHVRYGVRNGRYYDWTIELVARDGDVDTFRATQEHPVRYVMESVGVEASDVVRRVRTGPGVDDVETTVVKRLTAGDGALVDGGYDYNLKQLADQWDQRHETRDPHTIATFGFAQKNRDAEFRDSEYPWVRNTVVCIDTDPSEDTVVERLATYFPDGGTLAVHCRGVSRMKFLKAGARSEVSGSHDVGG